MKEDLSNLKVGDKVYSITYGWGVINDDYGSYWLFKSNDARFCSYLKDGRVSNSNQILFTYNPFEKLNEFPKWMEYENFKGEWIKTYVCFQHPIHKTYLGFFNEEMLIPNCNWHNRVREIKEPEVKEVTMKEIAEKFGVEQVKIIDG